MEKMEKKGQEHEKPDFQDFNCKFTCMKRMYHFVKKLTCMKCMHIIQEMHLCKVYADGGRNERVFL